MGENMEKAEVKIHSIIEDIINGKYITQFNEKATLYEVNSSGDKAPRKYEADIVKQNGRTDNKVSEDILQKYFQDDEKLKLNTDIETVLIKVTLLNAFYRTAINNIHLVAVARYIQSLDIDSKLAIYGEEPNFELINEIAYMRENDYVKFPVKRRNGYNNEMNNLYSFATKYCAWHKPNIYPIADSYTKGVLYRIFHDNQGFRDFMKKREPILIKITQEDLNDYKKYYCVCKGLKDYINTKYKQYGLLSFKNLDIFLWSYGVDNNIKI